MSDPVKLSIPQSSLLKIPISITITLSSEEWESFSNHCEKSGNAIGRKIAEQSKVGVDRIRKAMSVLSGKYDDTPESKT